MPPPHGIIIIITIINDPGKRARKAARGREAAAPAARLHEDVERPPVGANRILGIVARRREVVRGLDAQRRLRAGCGNARGIRGREGRGGGRRRGGGGRIVLIGFFERDGRDG